MSTPHWPDIHSVALEDWGPSKNIVAGTPHTSGKVLHINPDGSSECALWSCTPGQRRVNIANDEFCVILSGRGRYIEDGGDEIEVKPGVAIFFRKGWTGLCIITETVTKALMSR